jgi:uncharacterized lipoprotein YmbA
MLKQIQTAALLLAVSTAAGCSPGQPEPDPVALDRTLNNLIAAQDAERARLVEEARVREELREQEMDQRRNAYSGNAGENASGNASANVQ